MALVNISVEPGLLKELIQVLTRIAAGIDRAYPPPRDSATFKGYKPHGPEDIVEFNPESEWQKEQEEEARQS